MFNNVCDPLHMACMHLNHGYVNGRIDNEFKEHTAKLVNDAHRNADVWSFFPGVEKIVVHTYANTQADPFEKTHFAGADLYFFGIDEPLDMGLYSGRTRWPRLPLQMFDEFGKYKQNPYCPHGQQKAEQLSMLFFIGLQRFVGGLDTIDYFDKNPILSVEADASMQSVKIERVPNLNEDLVAKLEEELVRNFAEKKEHILDDLIANFVPAMKNKVHHGFKKVDMGGQEGVMNDFQPIDWDEEDLSKSLKDIASELSLESAPGCPAYISHGERLMLYAKKLIPDLCDTQPPFNSEDHGVDADSWERVYCFLGGQGIQRLCEKLIYDMFDENKLTLGKLLNLHRAA